MQLWDRLDDIAKRHDVLRHPFYVAWSQGALTRDDLACYAGQYRHAVVALADAAGSAARSPEAREDAAGLAAHATEEREHVRLWDEFVDAVGGNPHAAPTAETAACASVWAGDDGRPLLPTIGAMYAIEAAQPAISAVKQEGLERYYGIENASYFSVHRDLDVEHAAAARELISRRLGEADQGEILDTAERVLEANWSLLDGVQRLIAPGG